MRYGKKLYAALTAAVVAAAFMAAPVYAASRTKISSLKLEVKDGLQIGSALDEEDELEIDTSADTYSVSEWEIVNEGFNWSEDDVPEVKVTLETDDDYYFSVTKDKVKIKGAEATVASVKKENSQEIYVTLKLKPMKERVGAIEYAYLNGTTADWAPAYGAASYDVYLYRDNKAVGSKRTTAETTLNFGTSMNKQGEYYYKVRAVGGEGKKEGAFTESPTVYRTAADIAAGNSTADTAQGVAADTALQSTPGKWVEDGAGWRFFKEDGTQPANSWLQINGKWYFFQEDGHMATGWISWNGFLYYLGPDGDMWVNRDTPDGHFVNESGAAIR